MKIWYGYGSEHSMNLVMIGEFEDMKSAADAMRVINDITGQVDADVDAGHIEIGEHTERFSDEMLNLLIDLNVLTVGVDEVQQFAYDVNVKHEGSSIVVTTDEADVSAFLKVMLHKGARVQIYSAHDFPDTGYGRGGSAIRIG